MITIIGAAASAVLLFCLPDIYSHPLQFCLAYGFCAIAGGGVLYLAERKPDLVISADGIQASVWGDSLVRWDEVERAFVVSRQGIDYLCLTLLQADDFRARSGPVARMVIAANRLAKLGDLMIRPRTLRLNAKETLQLIEVLTACKSPSLNPDHLPCDIAWISRETVRAPLGGFARDRPPV